MSSVMAGEMKPLFLYRQGIASNANTLSLIETKKDLDT